MKFPLCTIVVFSKEPTVNNDDKAKTANPEEAKMPLLKQDVGDILTELVTDKWLKMPSIPKEERLAKLSDEQQQQLQEIIDRAIREWHGQFDELESALGMLLLGHHVGWKVLYLIHSKKTIRKYEELLDIKIREVFPERGPSSKRSVGLTIADTYPNFWKIVSGDIKIRDRRTIE